MLPDMNNLNASTPVMRVEMQGANDHILNGPDGTSVCSNGICPGSDGYFRFISKGKTIGEYYFASQSGYSTVFDPKEDKSLMLIHCQDKKTECKLWDDPSCDH